MAMPLFKSLHYSNTDIATVTKLFGFGVALAGTVLAGYVVPRIGMMASLLAGTVFGSASHLSLAYLALHGGDGGNATNEDTSSTSRGGNGGNSSREGGEGGDAEGPGTNIDGSDG